MELFNFKVSPEERTALMKRAAQLTLATGRRVTMSDLLRNAIALILDVPVETENGSKPKAIEFIPSPGVEKALRRAHFNSAKPMEEIVNELLAEALQSQEMSL